MRRQRLLLLALVALAPSLALGGKLYKEWSGCAGYVRQYSVSWYGPWNSFGSLELQTGPSNYGPWTTVLSNLKEADCYFPAINNRWYRIWTLLGGEKARVWVPLRFSFRGCNLY